MDKPMAELWMCGWGTGEYITTRCPLCGRCHARFCIGGWAHEGTLRWYYRCPKTADYLRVHAPDDPTTWRPQLWRIDHAEATEEMLALIDAGAEQFV